MRITIGLGIVLSLAACVDPPAADETNPGEGEASSDVTVMGPRGPYFTYSMFFNRDVSAAPVSTASASIISSLEAAGGWGSGNVMKIDFALDVLQASSSTPMRSFTPNSEFYSPDCDHVAMPVPSSGNLEDETGYACTTDGDCHLLVFQKDSKVLYEMYRANITSTFSGGCLAKWDGNVKYTSALRGDQCTSADAAGFPIAPLLFTADEIKAGHIDHAIRFILPNDRVRKGYVRPATHATNTTGGANAPYYGVHLRLRANYPIGNLKPAAQVVARAMQRYGMYHADGGNIALTAQSDRHTTAKWADVGLGSSDLSALRVEDFEVISHGSGIALTGDCQR